jgi:hypothetical protein
MKEKYESVIKIKDLTLASLLITLGFPLLSIDNRKENETGILFGRTNSLNTAIDNYHRGILLIEPKKYWTKSKELKGRLDLLKTK